jgi:hypothetical protein
VPDKKERRVLASFYADAPAAQWWFERPAKDVADADPALKHYAARIAALLAPLGPGLRDLVGVPDRTSNEAIKRKLAAAGFGALRPPPVRAVKPRAAGDRTAEQPERSVAEDAASSPGDVQTDDESQHTTNDKVAAGRIRGAVALLRGEVVELDVDLLFRLGDVAEAELVFASSLDAEAATTMLAVPRSRRELAALRDHLEGLLHFVRDVDQALGVEEDAARRLVHKDRLP